MDDSPRRTRPARPVDAGAALPDHEPRRRSTLPWYLAGWVTLSAVAVLAALVLFRASPHTGPAKHDAQRPAKPTSALRADGPARGAPAGDVLTTAGSTAWTVRLGYSAVEGLHHDAAVAVVGCTDRSCARRRAALGAFPRSFLAAVRDQGSGLITAGSRHGDYLTWDTTYGYRISPVPTGPGGTAVRRNVSATSTTPLLPEGTTVHVVVCGTLTPRSRQADAICRRIRTASWDITAMTAGGARDASTGGTVGATATVAARSIWLYLGPETRGRRGLGPTAAAYRDATVRIG